MTSKRSSAAFWHFRGMLSGKPFISFECLQGGEDVDLKSEVFLFGIVAVLLSLIPLVIFSAYTVIYSVCTVSLCCGLCPVKM